MTIGAVSKGEGAAGIRWAADAASLPSAEDWPEASKHLFVSGGNVYRWEIGKRPTLVFIAADVQRSFALRRESERLLDTAKKAVEIAIEQGEDIAPQWMTENGAAGTGVC